MRIQLIEPFVKFVLSMDIQSISHIEDLPWLQYDSRKEIFLSILT